jgi:branched-chain amino acid transport system substrate-binding protein
MIRNKHLKSGRLLALGTAIAATTLAACAADDAGGSSDKAPKELVIAVSAPMSDPIYGQVVSGFKARLDAANADGGVAGHTFKVVSRDNKATPDGGATTVRSLLGEKPFAMMVQGSGSYSSAALILANQDKNLPVFVVASATVVATANLDNAFGLYPDYVRECYLDVDYLVKTLGEKSVAIAYQDDALGQTSGDLCPKYAESLGVSVTAVPVATGTTDFGSAAAKLRDSDAEGVVVVSLSPIVAGLQAAADRLGYSPDWVTLSSNATSADLFSNGTYVTNWLRPLSSSDPEVAAFKEGMKDEASAQTPLGASGWTMAEVLIDAVNTTSEDGELTQENLLDTLKTFERPEGIAMAGGSMSYAEDQSTLVTALSMYQWNGKELVEVAGPQALPTGPQ